jgi:hypothetical protein
MDPRTACRGRGEHGRRDVGHGIFAQRSTLGPTCCWRKVALNTTSRPEPWDRGRRSFRSWRWARVGRRHHVSSLRRQSWSRHGSPCCFGRADRPQNLRHALPNMTEAAIQPDKQADTASARLAWPAAEMGGGAAGSSGRWVAGWAVGGGYCWVGGSGPGQIPATRNEIHGRVTLGGLGIVRECWTLGRLARGQANRWMPRFCSPRAELRRAGACTRRC